MGIGDWGLGMIDAFNRGQDIHARTAAEVFGVPIDDVNETVRPLTDHVSMGDPETVPYDIEFTYYIPRSGSIASADIAVAVDAAVEEYKAWQCSKLGRDINPSYLISLLMKTGIKRVDISSPVFTQLKDGSSNDVPQIAQFGTATIVNGGVEDE